MPRPNGNLRRDELRKLRKKCTKCGKTDAYTLNGRSFCDECAEKERIRGRESYPKQKERHSARQRTVYQQRKTEGLCTRCGTKPAAEGRLMCDICAARQKKQQIKDARRKGVISRDEARIVGICVRCMKNTAAPGSALCTACGEWWESVRCKSKVVNEFTRGVDAYWANQKNKKRGDTNGA